MSAFRSTTHRRFSAVLVLVLAFSQPTFAQTLYWTDTLGTADTPPRRDAIYRSNLDGTQVELVVVAAGNPVDVAVDSVSQQIYWTDPVLKRIQKSNLDGSNIEDAVPGQHFAYSIAIDAIGRRLLWSEAGRIMSFDMDTLTVSASAGSVSSERAIHGIALDPGRAEIYWAQPDPDFGLGTVMRQNALSGQKMALVPYQFSIRAAWVAVDSETQEFYWSSFGNEGTIFRNQTAIATSPKRFDDLALDGFAKKVYWASPTDDRIERSNYDGSDREVVIDGLGDPNGLFIQMIESDFDNDGRLSAHDIDGLSNAVRHKLVGAPGYDLDQNGILDDVDRQIWVESKANTYFGDANLDGVFDFKDFVDVFTVGEYEDSIDANSGWADGDWNGDGDFSSGDLVYAFISAGYLQLPKKQPLRSVPEPTQSVFDIAIAVGAVSHARNRKSCFARPWK